MNFFEGFENEYEENGGDEEELNYNIRRDIEAGCSRREIMRKYGVSGDYADAMDVRHLFDDEEENGWY